VDQRILITGAGGRIGRMLRGRLARPGRILRLADRGAQDAPADGEAVELCTGDITDAGFMDDACAGVDTVIHLGALKTEDTWENLIRVNVDGARTVLESARRARVPRVLLASSVHAVGFYQEPGTAPVPSGVPAPAAADGVPALIPVRPDSYYGVSKAAVEALASLYADRYGMAVFALRLGDCAPEPPGEWALHSWLSPDDCARLVEACLTADVGGYRVLWGISRNTRRWWSLAEGEAIGYYPRDDAEEYAGKVTPATGDRAATLGLLGGRHTTVALGVPR
jgi:NAD(P)-dependent dehydrogenase (short-subunit alcohol dehydrogenase family)